MGVECPLKAFLEGDLSGRFFSVQERMDIGRLCPRMSTADQRLGCFRF